MDKLTKRQRRILEYIDDSIWERGYPPTLREIAGYMGIRSTNGVSDHIRALEKKGYVELDKGKSRGLRVLVETREPTMVELPLFTPESLARAVRASWAA